MRNLTVQGIADFVKNTTTFERSCLAGVANICVRRAAAMTEHDSLQGHQCILPQCPDVKVADRAAVGGVEVSRGDFVAWSKQLGVVMACYLEGDQLGVLVEVARVTRWLADHSAVAGLTGTLQAWPASELALCTAWKQLAGDDVLVVCQ